VRKLYIGNLCKFFDFGKILYEAIFSSLRGYKDIEGVFGWGVNPSSRGSTDSKMKRRAKRTCHGGDKKNGTPRPNWATPRNAHKSSTFSISSLFAPHLAVVFTHVFSMSSPTHHEIEEIEKVDDLCAFRGVAQLGLGVPFFLSPPCLPTWSSFKLATARFCHPGTSFLMVRLRVLQSIGCA